MKSKKSLISNSEDWDVHHGNGIQHSFESSQEVLYISLHYYDHGSFYPGGRDGDPSKVGIGKGEGYNINIAWNGYGPFADVEYLSAFDSIVIPAVTEFQPDLILISAGFDAGINDPIGECDVTPTGFGKMLEKLKVFAEGRILLALEGGYNLQTISSSMLCCANVLLGDKIVEKPPLRPISKDAKDAIRQTVNEHLKLKNPFSQAWTCSKDEQVKVSSSVELKAPCEVPKANPLSQVQVIIRNTRLFSTFSIT